jgi:UDP-N-acetylmuramyl pentapeptide phosphotransferase/UDP-N-acetylglucosamine-1-phosphate transferase
MNALDAHRATLAIAAAVAAGLICAGLTKLLLPLLRRYALARPNARSSHVEPTPQGGGIAVIAASLSTAGIARPDGASIFRGAGATPSLRWPDLQTTLSISCWSRLLLQAAAIGAVLLSAPADLGLCQPRSLSSNEA